MRRLLLILLCLPALAAGRCDRCPELLTARDAACAADPAGQPCLAAQAAVTAAGCTATTPPPTTLPPGPPPITLPPAPPPPPGPAPSGCVLAGEVGLEPVPGHVQALGDQVNAVMAVATGCEVGSTCVLHQRPQEWQATVEAGLRARGLCAGQHTPETDEIAVALDPRDPGGDIWEGYHIAAGPGWDTPGGRLTVVWSYGTQTEPVGAPPRYVGANRPAWRAPAPATPPPVVAPPVTAACPYRPLPEQRRIAAKPHVGRQVDSTPQVGDAAYCAARGWTDGRTWCAVAQEGDAARTACEAELLGRPCPVWSFVGAAGGLRIEYSGEDADVAHCGADAGFVAWVGGTGSGAVRACNADGSLCSPPVPVVR